MTNAIDVIRGDIHSAADQFQAVRVDQGANFDAEAGFAIQTLMNNDYAMAVAMKNRQSVVDAVTNIAAIGISLNPAKKQAYLVPRDNRICLDISYMGLMDLAMQSGSIRWAQCAIVYEKDDFALAGLDKQPVHKFNPFATDRGHMVGVYCVVKTADGDFLTHTMPIADVFAIRDRSSAWRAWIEKKRKCPWVTDEGEMVKKTCVKQAYKYWPKGEKSDRLERAIHYLNEQAGEGLARDAHDKRIVVSGTDGAMESLSRDEQTYIRELAAELESLFDSASVADVIARIQVENLESEQKVALWSLLDSKTRSAIKAEQAAQQEAIKALKSAKEAA